MDRRHGWLEIPDASRRVRARAAGPEGALPLVAARFREAPTGEFFGLVQAAGMGWDPARLAGGDVLILSTAGGLRDSGGQPVALGFHTGHWEVVVQVREAALTLAALGLVPFAAAVSDPCDGRTQGTAGMMHSLPFRNDAAVVLGRLVGSLPTRKGVLGIATCDKGLPAMMMTLAAADVPAVCVPGGVTLPPAEGEDAGTVQSLPYRYAHGEVTLGEAAQLGCRACASPGGGCQFLGTAATSQVVAEALGMALPHSALAPSGEPVWLQIAADSARALAAQIEAGTTLREVLTPAAIRNAMIVHAAFAGSTNLVLHLPAVAHAAGRPMPRVEDWIEVGRRVPRIVDVLPNGPRNHPTVDVWLAGGVPEVMLRLRDVGLLDGSVRTVTGLSLEENLALWERSERRRHFRQVLHDDVGTDAEDVILDPPRAAAAGMTSPIVFPRGNLAPEGSVVKAAAIESALCPGGLYCHEGRARVFTTEDDARRALRSTGDDRITPGDVVVLICRGPLGAGMPETAEISLALRYTDALRGTALITDGRFSGFTSGPCIGHVGPEALAGGPIGRLQDGDIVRLVIDRQRLEGAVDLVGDPGTPPDGRSPEAGSRILAERPPREDLRPAPDLPASTRLWAALQSGPWRGCVYDVDEILRRLR